jgi:hypothetical protein
MLKKRIQFQLFYGYSRVPESNSAPNLSLYLHPQIYKQTKTAFDNMPGKENETQHDCPPGV